MFPDNGPAPTVTIVPNNSSPPPDYWALLVPKEPL
jgi:hypothetical protein